MPRPREALADYVVQLDVEAIAVVTVRAGSVEAACAIAARELRPVDVTDVRTAEAALVSQPHACVARGGAGILRRGRQEPQEAPAHGGQGG
jgi:hypothetical protein